MTLVQTAEADTTVTSPLSAANPANTERYGDELRETYLDRADKLAFRVDDGTVEHRFFENGRPDAVKQVIENRAVGSRVVRFGLRADNCTALSQTYDRPTSTAIYTAEFDGRKDGLRALHVALRSEQAIDVGTDSAASLIREKLRHAAVTFDPTVAVGRTLEVYQDHAARELRVITQENDYAAKKITHKFSNDVPSDDPRYEAGKISMVNAVRTLVDLERELFLNLLPFIPGESNEDRVCAQRARLYELSQRLFAAFDEVSSAQL